MRLMNNESVCKKVQTMQTQGATCHFNKTKLMYFHTNWGTKL